MLGTAAIFHTGGGQVGTRGCSNCKVTSTERFGVIARNKICTTLMLSRYWPRLQTDLLSKASPLQGTPTPPTGESRTSLGILGHFCFVERRMAQRCGVGDRFDNAHEIIFEHNVIRPAGTAPSWGNNIDNVSDINSRRFQASPARLNCV